MKYTLPTTGSPYGVSAVEQILRCPERWCRRQEEDGRIVRVDGAPGIGTIGHAFMDIYFSKKVKRGFDFNGVEFVSGDEDKVLLVDERARIKATDIMNFFRGKYDQNALGRVVSREFAVESGPGWGPLTGRLDVVIKLTKQNLSKFKRTWNIQMNTGLYPLDYKFVASLYPTTTDPYLHNLQASAYPRMLAEVRKGVNGMLFLFISKTSVPQMQMRLVTVGEVVQRAAALDYQIHEAQALRIQRPYFTTDCYSWREPCPYLVSAECPAWRRGT